MFILFNNVLDGASGLLLVLGISVVLNVVVFMYFRNKTMALENGLILCLTLYKNMLQ